MDRFIALLWDPRDEAQTAAAEALYQFLLSVSQQWTAALDAPGLRVVSRLQQSDTPVIARLDGVEGIIVGRIFRRGAECAGSQTLFDATDASDIVTSSGDSLLRDYWGNYLALWRDRACDAIMALRDPCGGVPCFVAQADKIGLLFSHAEDVASLPGVHALVNWHNVLAFVVNNYFPARLTGLHDVVELLPGERLSWRAANDITFTPAWKPVRIAANRSISDFNDARRELREIGETCLGALGGAYRSVVVRTSGGLDSSIVLNLLSRTSGARVTAMHLAATAANDRERAMARLAADQAGVELIEAISDPAAIDLRTVLHTPRLARPTKHVLGLHADALAGEICDRVGADALATGHGGDTLFMQRSTAEHMLCDYVRLHGIGRAFWSIAYDTAMLLERPVAEVVRKALGGLINRKTPRPYSFLQDPAWRQRRLLRPEAIAALPEAYLQRPWIAETNALPRGKAAHLHGMLDLRHYHGVLGTGLTRDALIPLVSQPIVEFCLRTPTFLFGSGGVDRSLERKAFADMIPSAIARRMDKGVIDQQLSEIMKHNLPFIRELILDGVIVQHGWFDRARLERALDGEHLMHGHAMEDIFNLIAAEAWLTSWRRM